MIEWVKDLKSYQTCIHYVELNAIFIVIGMTTWWKTKVLLPWSLLVDWMFWERVSLFFSLASNSLYSPGGLKLEPILWLQPPECWDTPPSPACSTYYNPTHCMILLISPHHQLSPFAKMQDLWSQQFSSVSLVSSCVSLDICCLQRQEEGRLGCLGQLTNLVCPATHFPRTESVLQHRTSVLGSGKSQLAIH